MLNFVRDREGKRGGEERGLYKLKYLYIAVIEI